MKLARTTLNLLTFAGMIGFSVQTNLRTLSRELQNDVDLVPVVPNILHNFVLGKPRSQYELAYARHSGKMASSFGMKYMLWTNWHTGRIAEIVDRDIPGALQTWKWIEAAGNLDVMTDFMTLLALYRYGGVTHDNDLVLCGKLDFMVGEPSVNFPVYIGQARTIDMELFSAPSEHPLLKIAIEFIISQGVKVKELESLRDKRSKNIWSGAVTDEYFKRKGIVIPELKLKAYRKNDEVEGQIAKGGDIWDLNIGGVWFADKRFIRTDTVSLPFKPEELPQCYEDPDMIADYLEFLCDNRNFMDKIRSNFDENCDLTLEELEAMKLF